MADTIQVEKQIKLVAGFADGDERTISFDNPRSDITAAEIRALEPLAKAAIIGDKYGAEFSVFRDAGIYETTKTILDLEDQG